MQGLSQEDVRDEVSAKLVEIGVPKDDALRIMDVIINAVESALMSSTMTLELQFLSLEDKYNTPAMHLALQLLQSRLGYVFRQLSKAMKADGAHEHMVVFFPFEKDQ